MSRISFSLSYASTTYHTFSTSKNTRCTTNFIPAPHRKMDSPTPPLRKNSEESTTNSCPECIQNEQMNILWFSTALVFMMTSSFLIISCMYDLESRHLALFMHSCGVIVMHMFYLFKLGLMYGGKGENLVTCLTFLGAGFAAYVAHQRMVVLAFEASYLCSH
jgi:hypothetical protein